MYDDSTVKPIKFINYKAVGSAGGVWSCVDDINKWMLFLLDSAKVNGTRLLKPETYCLLFTPASFVTPEQFYPTAKLTKPHWMTYGLGWFQEDYRGKMVNFHTGSLDGAVAICGLINDEHFGVYIFANRDHTEMRHALMYKAMDLWVWGDDKNDWSRDMFAMYNGMAQVSRKEMKDFEAKRVADTKPSLPLKDYTGAYASDIYGSADIALTGDSLLTLTFPNSVVVRLSHWHYNTFLGKFANEWNGKDWLTFNFNAEGKVTGFNFLGLEYGKKE
jgi:hypothetical protein